MRQFKPTATAQVATIRGVHLSAGVYRAQFLRDLGPFDESFEQAEDTDYLLRIREPGGASAYRHDLRLLSETPRKHDAEHNRGNEKFRACGS